MSKFFIATAAVIAAAGMVLAGCGNLAAGDTFFTVRFEADGGSPAPGDQAVAGNGKATEPAAMTRAGYTFGGWYTEAAFATRWNFATNTVSGDITLYAKWLNPSEALTVTFEADGGSPAPEPRAVANGDTAPEPAAMTKAGYSFEGWYRDAAFAAPWNFAMDAVTEAVTLYAKWAADASAGGTGNDIPGKPPQGTGIYIAGIYDADDYTDVACYWKLDWNITAENLAPQKLSDGSSSSWAADIAAGKNGIYVAGFYVSRDKTACYWHDDGNTIVKKDLSVPQGARYSEAFSVYLAADGLYFAGYVNIGTGNKACYWDSKGDIHILEDAGESYARDIAVDSGGKIYIAGEKNFFTGCLWIADSDGIRVVELSNASRAESIAIDSAKIYVGGRTANEKACYWTVENETVTSSRVYSSSGTTSNVYGITVNNSSVYCAGDDGGIACYWGPSGNKIFVRGNENDQRSRALGIAVDSYDNIHIAEGAGYIKIVGGVGGTPYVTDLGGGLEAIVVVE